MARLTLPQWRVVESVLRATASGSQFHLTTRDAKVLRRALTKIESEVRQRQHRLDQSRWHRVLRNTNA